MCAGHVLGARLCEDLQSHCWRRHNHPPGAPTLGGKSDVEMDGCNSRQAGQQKVCARVREEGQRPSCGVRKSSLKEVVIITGILRCLLW